MGITVGSPSWEAKVVALFPPVAGALLVARRKPAQVPPASRCAHQLLPVIQAWIASATSHGTRSAHSFAATASGRVRAACANGQGGCIRYSGIGWNRHLIHIQGFVMHMSDITIFSFFETIRQFLDFPSSPELDISAIFGFFEFTWFLKKLQIVFFDIHTNSNKEEISCGPSMNVTYIRVYTSCDVYTPFSEKTILTCLAYSQYNVWHIALYTSHDVYNPFSRKRVKQVICITWCIYANFVKSAHFWKKKSPILPKMTFLKNEITKLCRKVLKWRFRGYASQGNYMYQKPRILDLSDDGLTRFHYSDNGTQEYSQTFLKFMFISFLGNFIWILYGFHFFPKVLLDVVLCIFWDVLSEICFEQTAPYYLWSWWIFIRTIFLLLSRKLYQILL